MIYRCIRECTWNGRYWKEGDVSDPLPDDVKPPEYFKPVYDAAGIQEVLDRTDEEENPETFAELSQQLLDVGKTGVGMLAGDDLQNKNYQQLRKIARDLGVYEEHMKTKDVLIDAIEAVEAEG